MKKKVSFTKDLEFPTMIGEITEITLEDNLKFINPNNVEGSFFVSGKYKMTEASRLEEDFSFNLPIEIEILENCELDTCKVSIADFNYEIVDDDILRSNIDVLVEGMEKVEETSEVSIGERNSVTKQSENSRDISSDSKEELILSDEADIQQEEIKIDKTAQCNDKERECDGDAKEEKELEIPMKQENEIKNDVTDMKSETQPENMMDTITNSNINIQTSTGDNNSTIEQYIKSSQPTNDNVNQTTSNTNPNSLFSSLTDEADAFSTYSISILREGDTIEKVMERYNISKEKLEEYNDLGSVTLNSKIIIPTSINE